jgi:hypothetical protein
VTATPTITTDYRLATSSVAAGSIRIRVMPVVTVTTATAAAVSGTVAPVLMGETAQLQQQNADNTWSTVGTATVEADGAFTVPAALAAGASVRVVVTPASTSGYAAGTSASQIVSG